RGQYIYVKGKINLFQGRKELVIQNIEKVGLDYLRAWSLSEDDFIKKSSESSEIMYEKLLEIINNLNDIYIRNLLLNIVQDEEMASRLKTWPAGKTIHHAYKSGLL